MKETEATPSSSAPSKKPRYFYGWNVVGASFLAHLSYSEHLSSVLGLFFRPLGAEFRWSRTAIAATQTMSRFIEAAVAPIVGPFVDRYGPRLLMPIGALITGIALMAVTQVTAIWQFYLFRGVLVALGFTLMGFLVTNTAVSNWFVRKRGRAIAISNLGTNLGNLIFTPITVWLIATSGWRASFVMFAVVTWLVVMVPSAVLMRRRPEDMGLLPDGDAPGMAPARKDPSDKRPAALSENASTRLEPLWNRRELAHTTSFWLLVVSFGLSGLAFQGINISLAPIIQDLGYSDTMVALVISVRALIQSSTSLIWGFVGERAYTLIFRIAPFLIQMVAAFLFLFADHLAFLWLAIVVYSLGIAGAGLIQEVIWANYFGRMSLGLVRSMGFPLQVVFSAAGPIFMNVIFDVTGSYRLAYLIFIGLFVIATIVLIACRAPKAKRYATPEEVAAMSQKQTRRGGGR